MTTWIPPGLSGRRALGNLLRVWRGSAPCGAERSQEPALWGSGVQATGSLDALEGWLTLIMGASINAMCLSPLLLLAATAVQRAVTAASQ